MILKYITDLTNIFNIAIILQKLNLNGSGNRGWIVKVKVKNAQILTLKMIYIYHQFFSLLAI